MFKNLYILLELLLITVFSCEKGHIIERDINIFWLLLRQEANSP